MDLAIAYLDNLIAICQRSIRTEQRRVWILMMIALGFFIIGLVLVLLHVLGSVEAEQGKMMLQFAAPSGGGGLLLSAFTVFPQKAIAPLEEKMERYRYLKECYVRAADLPEMEKDEWLKRMKELIDQIA
jgi:hypothetical protein